MTDLSTTAGDAYAFTLRVFSDVDQTTPVDVSSRTYTAQVRKAADRTAGILETFTVDDTDAATGVIVFHLSGIQTRAIYDAVVTGGWDVQYTDGGDPVTVTGGLFSVAGDYTR